MVSNAGLFEPDRHDGGVRDGLYMIFEILQPLHRNDSPSRGPALWAVRDWQDTHSKGGSQ